MRRRVGYGTCTERGKHGVIALQRNLPKTIFECPLIGNGDSVIIIMKRSGQVKLFIQSGWNREEYRPLMYSRSTVYQGTFFDVVILHARRAVHQSL